MLNNQPYKLVLATDETQTAVTYVQDKDTVFGGPWGSVDMEGNPLYIIVENTPALEDVKSEKLRYLDSAAAAAYVVGFESAASGTALWYDSDEKSQIQITNAALLAIASAEVFAGMYPSGITIRAKATIDTSDVLKQQISHSAAQTIVLGTDMQAMLKAKKDILWARQKAVNDATTVEAVEAIVW